MSFGIVTIYIATKHHVRNSAWTLLLVLISSSLFAQNSPTRSIRKHSFTLKADTILIDSLTLVPNTVQIISQSDNKSINYQIDNNLLHITKDSKIDSIIDSISVTYRVISYNLGTQPSLLDSTAINTKSRLIKIAHDYTKEESQSRRYIQSNKLEYSGSFTRGVNMGNTQDVVLDSDFNLQMRGDLGDGLKVNAAISDSNIPIQPEGNTQVLQEFDKVFIELLKDQTSIIAGDYELAKPTSYFMNYYKKLKGISVKNATELDKGWIIENKGSFAISRGKFKRLELAVTEGNQGPYKLTGNNNELYLQVLSGTEKVYSDGRLLKRGENYDYAIDYNRAEIRFTPLMIITANTRIIVEYEYATQEYLRSLYATESTLKKDKWAINFNFYNEQDSKNLSNNVQLDSTDLSRIENSGDRPAFRSGIFFPEDGDFDGIIKYRQTADSLIYAPNDSLNIVGANFSNVGEGLGAYDINTEAGANGRVYRYVGEGLGAFDTLLPLVTPEKRQLLTAGLSYNISDSTAIYLETGLSNDDRNRLSQINNEDNIGLSLHATVKDIRIVGKNPASTSTPNSSLMPDTLAQRILLDTISIKETSLPDNLQSNKNPVQKTKAKGPWILTNNISIEFADKNFKALNPYRKTEFIRDWNVTSDLIKEKEILFNTYHKISNNRLYADYSLNGYFNGLNTLNTYKGLRHILGSGYSHKGWTYNGQYDNLNSESALDKTRFFRPKLLISKDIYKGITIGSYYEKEENVRRLIDSDDLSLNSFNYDLYKLYIETDKSNSFSLSAAISQRKDERVFEEDQKKLQLATISNDYTLGGAWTAGQTSNLNWQMTYRDYQVQDIYLESDANKKTFIGTLDHKFSALKNGLSLSTFYEANSGQEPKIEFQYIEVQQGEGSYIWLDNVTPDSIQQVYEFRLATFGDQGDYERISVFNNEFINTNKSVLNQTLRIIPKKFIKNPKHILGRVQLNSKFRLDQRIQTDEGGKQLLKPITFNLADSTIISANSAIDHSLFFNRGQIKYDLQLSYRALNTKQILITGQELRSQKEIFGKIRLNLTKPLDFIIEASQGQRQYETNFDTQNFIIDFWKLVPQLNYRPSAQVRIIAKYKKEKANNIIGLFEVSDIQDLSLDFTWRKSSTSSFQASFNAVLITFSGTENSPLEFEMLQGLKNGQNYLWSLNYTRRVSKNFDLILNYNGRKSETARLVNNAGLQLRAIF